MNRPNTIQDELKNLNSSLPVTHSPSYSVPEGYFENLAAIVLAKIKSSEVSDAGTELAELSPLLAGLSKTTPYSVPSSYFNDNLQSNPIIETGTGSPVLAAIGKALPYNVPADYFDGLPQQILAKVSEPKAKVVPLFRRTWLRATAAAVIVGGLLIGGLQLFSGKGADGTVAVNGTDTLSKLTAQATLPIQQEIKNASTKDLEEFIQKAAPSSTYALAKKDAPKKEASDLLKDVSVSDMEDFLSAVPQADEELFASDEP